MLDLDYTVVGTCFDCACLRIGYMVDELVLINSVFWSVTVKELYVLHFLSSDQWYWRRLLLACKFVEYFLDYIYPCLHLYHDTVFVLNFDQNDMSHFGFILLKRVLNVGQG